MSARGFGFGVHSVLISPFCETADIEILDEGIAEKLIKAHDEAARMFIIFSARSVSRPDVLEAARHYKTVMNVLSCVIDALPYREHPGAEGLIAGDSEIHVPKSDLEIRNE